MEILDYQIIYIDNIEGTASIAVFPEKESIDKYTIDLITRAFSKQDRKYKFNDNKRTTRDRVLNIAANKMTTNPTLIPAINPFFITYPSTSKFSFYIPLESFNAFLSIFPFGDRKSVV